MGGGCASLLLHYFQVGVEVPVLSSASVTPEGGGVFITHELGQVLAPYQASRNNSLAGKGRGASLLFPMWPPLSGGGGVECRASLYLMRMKVLIRGLRDTCPAGGLGHLVAW